MHNKVSKKQKVFKQGCHSFKTNSELLPTSAYNCAIRSVLRRSIDIDALRCYFFEAQGQGLLPFGCHLGGGTRRVLVRYIYNNPLLLVLKVKFLESEICG